MTKQGAIKKGVKLAKEYSRDATIYTVGKQYYATICPDYVKEIMPDMEIAGATWPSGTYVNYEAK